MRYNYKNKNCIVSGGAGFIGQVLVRKLLKEKANVWVIDNFSFNASLKNIPKEAKLVKRDIREKSWTNELKNKKIDYFFHFAAPSSAILFKKDPKLCFDITFRGFLNVIDFCAQKKIRLVYPSSAKVYMGRRIPFSEKDPILENKLDAYARAKFVTEKIAYAYKDLVSSLGLRISAGFGPEEAHKKDFASVVFLFSKAMVKGKSPEVWGDGSQRRDFIYIEDLTETILTLAQRAKEPIINVGSGKAISYNKLIEIINSLLKKNIKPKYKKAQLALGDTLLKINVLKKYYPSFSFSFEEGVKKVLESLTKLPS